MKEKSNIKDVKQQSMDNIERPIDSTELKRIKKAKRKRNIMLLSTVALVLVSIHIHLTVNHYKDDISDFVNKLFTKNTTIEQSNVIIDHNMTPTVVEDHSSTNVSQKNSEIDGVLIPTTSYYIIVGCYKAKKVLENEKNRFTKMGYNCQVLPKLKNGFVRLSVASFDNEADADAWLRINKNIKALKDAWILKVDEDTVK